MNTQTAAPLSAPTATPVGRYRLAGCTALQLGDRQTQQDQVALLAHPHTAGCVLAVVADGMGGLEGGRQAADQVILTCRQLLAKFDAEQGDPVQLMQRIAVQAHTVIGLIAISAETRPHSTFAAALLVPGGRCVIAHSGDSRVYYFRSPEGLLLRTRDHSYVQQLVDEGLLDDLGAAAHPQSHLLTSCLGTQEAPQVQVQVVPRFRHGDRILVCSDGLWHYFDDAELGDLLYSEPPRAAAEYLTEATRARAQGTGDNLSLALLYITPPVVA